MVTFDMCMRQQSRHWQHDKEYTCCSAAGSRHLQGLRQWLKQDAQQSSV